MQTLASLSYLGTEILLQTETEQALLQLHQLSIFKASGPLKPVLQLGLPIWKTNKQLANLSTEQKMPFQFINFVKTEVTTTDCATGKFVY